MEQTVDIIMNLIRSEVDKSFALPWKSLSVKEISDAHKLAKKHSVSHLVSAAVVHNNLVEDTKLISEMNTEIYTSVMRLQFLKNELNKICNVFEKHKIEHMPLKGSIIREKYPEEWMRTCRDIDILVKPENHRRACDILCSELGYTVNRDNKNDRVLNSPKGFCIEVHHALMSDEYVPQAIETLDTVWETAERISPDRYLYHMSEDMFYYHHLVHMAKHCVTGGCGIRPILDLWVFRNTGWQMSKNLCEMLEKSNLLKFAETMNELCQVWFSGASHNEKTLDVEDFVINGGDMGNENFCHVKRLEKSKGRAGYIFSKLLLPVDKLEEQYPIIKKHPFLIPFCQLHRLLGFLFGNRRRVMKDEITKINSVYETELKSTRKAWKHLGLHKEF